MHAIHGRAWQISSWKQCYTLQGLHARHVVNELCMSPVLRFSSIRNMAVAKDCHLHRAPQACKLGSKMINPSPAAAARRGPRPSQRVVCRAASSESGLLRLTWLRPRVRCRHVRVSAQQVLRGRFCIRAAHCVDRARDSRRSRLVCLVSLLVLSILLCRDLRKVCAHIHLVRVCAQQILRGRFCIRAAHCVDRARDSRRSRLICLVSLLVLSILLCRNLREVCMHSGDVRSQREADYEQMPLHPRSSLCRSCQTLLALQARLASAPWHSTLQGLKGSLRTPMHCQPQWQDKILLRCLCIRRAHCV